MRSAKLYFFPGVKYKSPRNNHPTATFRYIYMWYDLIYLYRLFRKFDELTFFASTGSRITKSARIRSVNTKGYSKSGLPLINKEDYAILYGLVLGDLFISRKNSENAYLRFEQSIIHKQYLVHLFEKFNYLCTTSASIKVANRRLFNTSSVYFTTRQLTAITELHTLPWR